MINLLTNQGRKTSCCRLTQYGLFTKFTSREVGFVFDLRLHDLQNIWSSKKGSRPLQLDCKDHAQGVQPCGQSRSQSLAKRIADSGNEVAMRGCHQGVIGSMMPRLSVKLHSARLNQSQPNHVSLIFARVKQLWESSYGVDVSLVLFLKTSVWNVTEYICPNK